MQTHRKLESNLPCKASYANLPAEGITALQRVRLWMDNAPGRFAELDAVQSNGNCLSGVQSSVRDTVKQLCPLYRMLRIDY